MTWESLWTLDTYRRYSTTLNEETKEQQDCLVVMLADANTFQTKCKLQFWQLEAVTMSCCIL